MSASSSDARRIGFISTRIAGTDGVSLEIGKWARVLEEMGLECYYVAGECDRPPERTALVEEAHFAHPVIREIDERAFVHAVRHRPWLAQRLGQAITSTYARRLHSILARVSDRL